MDMQAALCERIKQRISPKKTPVEAAVKASAVSNAFIATAYTLGEHIPLAALTSINYA
ncbi:hypothetical protein ACK36B_18350 [Aeromonas veronii]|jgi:hypothetical protein